MKQGPQMPPEQRANLMKLFLGNEQQFQGRLVTNLNVVRWPLLVPHPPPGPCDFTAPSASILEHACLYRP